MLLVIPLLHPPPSDWSAFPARRCYWLIPSSALHPLIGRRFLPDDAIGYSPSPALWPLIGRRSFPAR